MTRNNNVTKQEVSFKTRGPSATDPELWRALMAIQSSFWPLVLASWGADPSSPTRKYIMKQFQIVDCYLDLAVDRNWHGCGHGKILTGLPSPHEEEVKRFYSVFLEMIGGRRK